MGNRTEDMETALLQWRVAVPADEPAVLAMMRRFHAEDGIMCDAVRLSVLTDLGWGEVLLGWHRMVKCSAIRC